MRVLSLGTGYSLLTYRVPHYFVLDTGYCLLPTIISDTLDMPTPAAMVSVSRG